jgi:hypothetical protein
MIDIHGKNGSSRTFQPTAAQTATLKKLPYHQILARHHTGALVVAFEHANSLWVVIDAQGSAYRFDHFLSLLNQPI